MFEQTQSNAHSLPYAPIFARYAEFVSDLPPDACLDRLMGLSHQPIAAGWMRANLTAERGSAQRDSYAFRIGVERHLRAAFINAQYVGVVQAQEGKTVVRGNFSASTSHMLGLAALLLLLAAGLLFAPFLIMVVIIISILSTWEIYADYRALEAHIEMALQPTRSE